MTMFQDNVNTNDHNEINACPHNNVPLFLYSDGYPLFSYLFTLHIVNIGTLFRCCVLGQGTSPSNASLDSGENEYLVVQRWQCVR